MCQGWFPRASPFRCYVMNLSGLLPLIEEALDGERMSRLLPGRRAPSGSLTIGVPDGAKAALIALLAQRTMPTGRQATRRWSS